MTVAVERDPIYRGRRFQSEIIELCVRWYLTYRRRLVIAIRSLRARTAILATHGSMSSCIAQCPVPMGAGLPAAFPMILRIALHSVNVPDAGAVLFADHVLPHLLRPPIV
jgi:hypothetical protein